MNYIYDIYLNLNKNLYDFFDWNKKDEIMHIKKIPIIKLNHIEFIKCLTNKIKLDNAELNTILKKTEIWNIDNEKINCALISDSNNIVAIEFDSEGYSIKKSYLMIDEELEILESINRIKEKNIKFKVLKKENIFINTRIQLKEKKFIENELNNIDNEKLTYIFFECFGKKEKDAKKILKEIKKVPKNSKIYKNLYDILKLTSI